NSRYRIHKLTMTYIPCPPAPRSSWSKTKPRPKGARHVHHGHLVNSYSHKPEHIATKTTIETSAIVKAGRSLKNHSPTYIWLMGIPLATGLQHQAVRFSRRRLLGRDRILILEAPSGRSLC
ncbi:hypothetical protein EV363DRAFT_1188050, partial [Boletus edulis]